MLRTLITRNFVRYRETQRLDFQEGAHFLIGANASGKTAIFELTRRCLSKASNTISHIPLPCQQAFAICKFKLNADLSESLQIAGLTNEKGQDLYSCHLVKPKEDDINNKKVFTLTYITEEREGKVNLVVRDYDEGHRRYKNNGVSTYAWSDTSGVGKQIGDLLKSLDKCEPSKIDGIVENIIKHADELKTDEGKKCQLKDSSCEKILTKVENVVVVTFPVRGHGPLQWNQSERMSSKNARRNYGLVSDGAEILQELLDSTDIDHDIADAIFETLISPLKYNFRKVERQQNDNNTESKPHCDIVIDNGSPLMKIPEGILEARQFSLLLAHSKYQTICFDEPDRGMHPPMVEKMRDLLLRKEQNKTLLVISHQPSMLGYWTFSRLFVCRGNRDQHDGELTHSIMKGSDAKVCRSDVEQFIQIIFSSSVLFVEGPSDKVILETVFDRILESDDESQRKLRGIIAGMRIVPIGGNTQYTKYRQLAKQIAAPYQFLLDKDAVFECSTEVRLEGNGTNKEKRDGVLRGVSKIVRLTTLPENQELKTDVENMLNKTVTTATLCQESSTSPTKKRKRQTSQQQESGSSEYQVDRGTVKDYLSLKFPPTPACIRTLVKKMILSKPDTIVRCKTKAVYGIAEEDISKGGAIDMELVHKRNIFVWDVGNLEDVLLSSIVEVADDKQMMDLLAAVILCQSPNKSKDDDKKAIHKIIKENILNMDYPKAKEFGKVLMESPAIKTCLRFLCQPSPWHSQ